MTVICVRTRARRGRRCSWQPSRADGTRRLPAQLAYIQDRSLSRFLGAAPALALLEAELDGVRLELLVSAELALKWLALISCVVSEPLRQRPTLVSLL